MGDQPKIKTADNIAGVVNDSFGFWQPSQIIVHERNIEGDYKALTDYLMRMEHVGRADEQEVTLHRLYNAIDDVRLSEEGQRAALQVWHDLSRIRRFTDNAGVYVQGPEADNATTDWHFHGEGVERTILCKYNGSATEIAKNKDVTSWGKDDPNRAFVVCDVKPDAKPVTLDNGHVFAMTGDARFFGKPTVHRKPPPDGEASLILISEPYL